MIGRARRWELPDGLAAVFLVAGISAVLDGLLPRAEAGEIVLRVLPLAAPQAAAIGATAACLWVVLLVAES